MLLTGWITTNQEIRNATNQSLSYIGFTLSAVLMTGWPCQQRVLMSYWQGDPVSSGWWCIIDRATLSAVGAGVLLTMLTGSPCQQWGLMSYWQGHPVSSGCWCIIDRVTLQAVGVETSYWQGDSRGCSWRRILSVWVIIDGLNSPNFGWLGRSPELRLLEWMQPYWAWTYLWSYGWCTTFGDSLLFAQQRSCCRVAYTKFYSIARFIVFQRLIQLFPLWEGGTSFYSRSHFNNFCWEDGGVMWRSTDWLIISLSITRINALLTGVSLSIATAFLDLHLSPKL